MSSKQNASEKEAVYRFLLGQYTKRRRLVRNINKLMVEVAEVKGGSNGEAPLHLRQIHEDGLRFFEEGVELYRALEALLAGGEGSEQAAALIISRFRRSLQGGGGAAWIVLGLEFSPEETTALWAKLVAWEMNLTMPPP